MLRITEVTAPIRSTKLRLAKLKRIQAITMVLIFSTVGVLIIKTSGAATFVVNSEAEAGTIASVATLVDDNSASGGKSVRFGAVSTGGGTSWPSTPPAQICGNNAIL